MNEITTLVYQTQSLRIETIESFGVSSPEGYYYDQDEFEWVVITQGEATLEIEGFSYSMKKGATLMIAPHQKHRVVSTSLDCVWCCLFLRGLR